MHGVDALTPSENRSGFWARWFATVCGCVFVGLVPGVQTKLGLIMSHFCRGGFVGLCFVGDFSCNVNLRTVEWGLRGPLSLSLRRHLLALIDQFNFLF